MVARTISHPEYSAVPESVRWKYTEAEYAWLGDEERGRLIERETMPDMDVTE